MPSTFHETDLARLERRGRRRTLALAEGVDFSSNDYLALAGSPELRQAAQDALRRGVPLGSGGSRLLRGNHAEHEALEDAAARLFGSAGALWAGSGYSANSMLLAALPQPGDLVAYDAMVHASAHEGMRLSRAECRAFAHNDPSAAADTIGAWRAEGGRGTPWIAFETLYSMDGDTAPVAEFAALAEREGAMLLVDEAHAVGVCGPGGRGLAADLHGRADTIVLATCGKALGCEGALVLGPRLYRDFLVNRGRGFIFSTAPSPLIAATLRASLAIAAQADDRRERLRALVRHAAGVLEPLGIEPSGSHIQPIVIGDDLRTMEIAGLLQARGFDVRGIRPPTVPEGTARLRVSITLNVGESDIDDLAQALKDIL
ncbi:8-amino-7-oxononanoate synthase [Tsuneonella amylolytica]|uniref:8-amino-7-oxononanoate synthase n=1 Tax=Tsuneonella amylolytica TaxID=2338327 RepID=UPI000EA88D8D|nr:8-amino-7-oxononanoate synthase [Tsuneonella amylolytica]